ncbi:MAG: DUF4149 domain-containing protein [Candidatus Methylomirabilales bacterium]
MRPMRRALVIFLAAGVGTWLGAMVFLSFAVAPTAFALLESRHQAGDLVATTLNILYLSGYILGPTLVFVSVGTRPLARPLLWGIRTILLVLMTVSTLISRELVGSKLLSLRQAMGTMIEKVPADDPMRLLFQQWHYVSVLLMLFTMVAAVTVLFLLCLEGFREARG